MKFNFETIDDLVSPDSGVNQSVTEMLRASQFVHDLSAGAMESYPDDFERYRQHFANGEDALVEASNSDVPDIIWNAVVAGARAAYEIDTIQQAFQVAASNLVGQEVGWDGFPRREYTPKFSQYSHIRCSDFLGRGTGIVQGFEVGTIPDYKRRGSVTGLMVTLTGVAQYSGRGQNRTMKLVDCEDMIVAMDPLHPEMQGNTTPNLITTPQVVSQWQSKREPFYGGSRGGTIPAYQGM